jgi:hypothetical protein
MSASNNPNCPILASANHAITHEIRTARQQRLFFEMPRNQNVSSVGEAFMSPSKARRFVAYYRVSTERQVPGSSLPRSIIPTPTS